jgi:hypothetical protein
VSAREVAARHARERARLATLLRADARAAWLRVDRAAITATWAAQLPRLLARLVTAQLAAASMADAYVTAVLGEQGVSVTPAMLVNAASFASIASDGRSLAALMAQPAITAKTAIGAGYPLGRAMAAGGALAELAAHTQVADAGRVADQVALVARHQQGYVRMVVGKTCSRCIVLAGRWYRWNAGFNRHPKCDCVGIPAAESAHELRTDPKLTFAAMGPAEQDKVFGKAGAEAIRDGADIAKVVNARRGMTTADGRLYTTEAAGRRPRLMPEQIYREAKGDRDEAIRLLRLHRYVA